MVRLLAALICLAWSGAAIAQGLDLGRYHALVIGINNYRHLPPLQTAVNDASAVHDVLSRRYGFESELLLNPTRYDLVRKLDEMRAKLTEDDNLLIYYAGHGILEQGTDEGFWLPVDAEEDSQANWVGVYGVTRTLRAMTARHVLVIADSCYSGTLTREAPIALPTGEARRAELERIARKRARKALTSGGLEPVVDGGGDGHSVFTRALLEVLRENDDYLDGYQLYSRLRRQVVLNADQTPTYSDIRRAGDEGGDFVLVPLQASPPEPAVKAPSQQGDGNTLAVELEFWRTVKDSTDPAAFQAYLAKFPDGAFATLARNRLAELQGAAKPRPVAAARPQPQPQQPPDQKPAAPQTAALPPASGHPYDGRWVGTVEIWDEGPRKMPGRTYDEVEIVVRDGELSGDLPHFGGSWFTGRVDRAGNLQEARIDSHRNGFRLGGSLEEGRGEAMFDGWRARLRFRRVQ